MRCCEYDIKSDTYKVSHINTHFNCIHFILVVIKLHVVMLMSYEPVYLKLIPISLDLCIKDSLLTSLILDNIFLGNFTFGIPA